MHSINTEWEFLVLVELWIKAAAVQLSVCNMVFFFFLRLLFNMKSSEVTTKADTEFDTLLVGSHPTFYFAHSYFFITQATISTQLSKLPIIMPLPFYFSYFPNTTHTRMRCWRCQYHCVGSQKCLSVAGAFLIKQLQ